MELMVKREGLSVAYPLYTQEAGERSIFMVKRLPSGEIRAYDRRYDLIGTVESPEEVVAALAFRYGVDTWSGYTGGSDGLVGRATWLEVR
jgi:hypothetical protein